MAAFISGDELSDDEVIELVDHGSIERNDGVFVAWRTGADGVPWLRRLGEIRAAAPRMAFDGDEIFDDEGNCDDDD